MYMQQPPSTPFKNPAIFRDFSSVTPKTWVQLLCHSTGEGFDDDNVVPSYMTWPLQKNDAFFCKYEILALEKLSVWTYHIVSLLS